MAAASGTLVDSRLNAYCKHRKTNVPAIHVIVKNFTRGTYINLIVTDNSKATIESTGGAIDGTYERVAIAVNGTLMRGLELESNLRNLGGKFLCEDYTTRDYRIFSIDDIHPGMVRVPAPGLQNLMPVSVAVEIWSVPRSNIVTLLEKEPQGLSIGKVELISGRSEVLGVLAEPSLVLGKKDISDFPGQGIANFRDYIVKEGMRIIDEVLSQGPNLVADELATLRGFRNIAAVLRVNGELRGAVDLINYCAKKLDLTNRLFQNIPIRWTSSFQLMQEMKLDKHGIR